MTTGLCSFLGFCLDLEQTSLGMSTHSSTGFNWGTNLVTNLHVFWGSRLQVSSGTWKKKFFLTKNLKNINADTSDLNYLLDNSLFLIVTLFGTRFRYASRWTTQFSRHFFTLSLWRVFFHIFLFLGTSGYRPSWTIFSCGISWEIERKCD